ncbi:MAG: hypothetical protein ACREEK_22680 [Bradyrhizobium sp.]
MVKKSNRTNKSKLSERRRQARERRENVRNRRREAALRVPTDIATPLATIRIFPNVLQTGNSNAVMAILRENRPTKNVEGQYKMTGVVRALNIMLGIHTLLTYQALVALLGTGTRAKNELRALLGGPGDIDYRLKVGRIHLVEFTAFVSEDEVRRWAKIKYAEQQLKSGSVAGDGSQHEMIAAETEAVRLVFRAYQRAQLVLDAFVEAAELNDNDGAVRLERAFHHANTQLTAFEVVQVAIFTDVNPAELWPQYGAGFGQTFELARFIGRINSGMEATLGPELFDLTKQVLNSRAEESGLPVLWVTLRKLLNLHFSSAKLDLAIHGAEHVKGVIRVSRSTRELSVEDSEGFRYLIEKA